ncbi:BTAD domain-containing putative transcriptional regulator [Deinococcus sp. YIM 134068]|uniref:AfsR/SARP family transcriptional regulator n=1 Tax=Deinococcus lichenicola TaxID=3118910 RepID=UPI002F92EABE
MNALPWHLGLLGTVRLRGPDSRETRPERKLAALLALLALEGPTHRSRLVGLLWPETREAAARNNLVQMLRKLRSATGADLVGGGELLSLGSALDVDARRARDACTRGEFATLHRFGGELLAGLRYDDCPDLDDWLLAERERWTEWRVGAAREEAARLEREGRYDEAAARTRVLLDLNPLSEDAYRRCEAFLRRESGVDPLPETLSLLADIERGRLPAPVVPQALPLATLRPPTLVGREREWARMEAAWQAGQVIFICGEPGAGKTRLALESMFALSNDSAFEPTVEHADAILIRKTLCSGAVIGTVEKSLEVAGGPDFYRAFGLERLVRDVHGAPFHPLPEKAQQLFTGRLALGLEPVA